MNSLRSTKICLLLILCILSKISSGYWHKFPTNRRQTVPTQQSSTSLLSSQLSWDTINKDSSRNTQGLNEDWLKSLDVLEGKVEPLEISVEDLEKKYSKASKTRSKASFSLMVALPEVLKENNYVVLVNRTADEAEDDFLADDSNIVYVTAQELERKWRDSSLLPMGRPVDQFDVKTALLLFDEEEDEEIIGKNALIIEDGVFAGASGSASDGDSSTGIVMSSTAKLNADLALRHQLLRASQQQAAEDADALEMEKTEVDDGVEFIVTEDVRGKKSTTFYHN
jgi:hypothetical protein